MSNFKILNFNIPNNNTCVVLQYILDMYTYIINYYVQKIIIELPIMKLYVSFIFYITNVYKYDCTWPKQFI